MRPAVFLDRDDTIIDNRAVTANTPHPGDLFDPALVRLLPGAAASCARLREAGFALIVISNQGAVARGRCTISEVTATNRRMQDLLESEAGVRADAVYFCPYHPQGTAAPFNIEHPWRKPAPGMILAAAKDHALDLARSWLIGDAPRDAEAAIAAGIEPHRVILLVEGSGSPSQREGARGRVPNVDSHPTRHPSSDENRSPIGQLVETVSDLPAAAAHILNTVSAQQR